MCAKTLKVFFSRILMVRKFLRSINVSEIVNTGYLYIVQWHYVQCVPMPIPLGIRGVMIYLFICLILIVLYLVLGQCTS